MRNVISFVRYCVLLSNKNLGSFSFLYIIAINLWAAIIYLFPRMVLQLTEQILPSSMEICWKTELFTDFYIVYH